MPTPPDSPASGPAPGAAGDSSPRIPDHKLIRIIGQGSYGEVWLAQNVLGAYRAVKIVYQSTFRDKRPFDREFNGVQNFEPVSRLHDGLMDVLQVGRNSEAGYFYCVMELADDVLLGQAIDPVNYTPRTLAKEMAGHKRLPVETCLQVGAMIASALGFLHSRGLVHRDVKPSNIVFINGVPKLGDIGLVAEMSEARSYVGTEGFIPPEGPGTAQADIYSFGKVLYEISTGKDRHDYPELPSLLDETVHSRELLELNKIILKACRVEPRQRYQSAQEMTADLLALQRGQPVSMDRTRRRLLWAGAKATAAFLCLLAILVAFGLVPSPIGHARPVPAPAGLAAWWRAEGDANDAAGTNAGTLLKGATFTKGRVGRAFRFNGEQGYLEVPDSPDFKPEGSFSIEAWIYLWRDGGQQMILSKWEDSGSNNLRSFFLAVQPDEVLRFGIADFPHQWDPAFIVFDTNPGAIAVRTWSHVAAVYDQSTGTRRIFVNAVPVKERADAPITVSHGPGPLSIGAWVRGDGMVESFFGGLIDEIGLYNRALTANEIRAIYRAGSAGKYLPQDLARKP